MCYSPWGHKESDTTERLHFLSFFRGGAQERLRLLPGALPAEVAQARCWDWALSRDSPGTLQGGDQAFGLPAPLPATWPGPALAHLPS